MQACYFGCWERFGHGHYLYTPTGERIWKHPVGNWSYLDTTYAPQRRRPGVWRQTVVDTREGPFTLLGCWDTTGDSRPGSNSLFLLHGSIDFPLSIVRAREEFFELMQRISKSFPSLYARSPS